MILLSVGVLVFLAAAALALAAGADRLGQPRAPVLSAGLKIGTGIALARVSILGSPFTVTNSPIRGRKLATLRYYRWRATEAGRALQPAVSSSGVHLG